MGEGREYFRPWEQQKRRTGGGRKLESLWWSSTRAADSSPAPSQVQAEEPQQLKASPSKSGRRQNGPQSSYAPLVSHLSSRKWLTLSQPPQITGDLAFTWSTFSSLFLPHSFSTHSLIYSHLFLLHTLFLQLDHNNLFLTINAFLKVKTTETLHLPRTLYLAKGFHRRDCYRDGQNNPLSQ